MTPHETLKKSLREFEEKLLNEWVNQIDYDDIQSAKSHLTTTFLSLIDSVMEMLEDQYRGQRKVGADLASFQPRVDDMDFGWNDAVSKAISLLQQEKDKIKKI